MKGEEYEVILKDGTRLLISNVYQLKNKKNGVYFNDLTSTVAYFNASDIKGYIRTTRENFCGGC